VIQLLEKNRWLAIILTIISAFLIYFISSLTFTGTGSTSQIAVIYHFTAFSYLTLFLVISLTRGKPSKSLIIIAMLITLIYGILDEIHQSFVPGRFASHKDILINSFGIILTGLAYSNWTNRS
jgi:VanZ family protein